MQSSKILTVESEIVNIVKRILSENNACYCRKYTQVLVHNKVPTGKRSHKFYGVYSKLKSNFDIVCEINEAIRAVSDEYIAVKVFSPFNSVVSINIRPIY